jgi:hypothetical protein
VQNAVADLAWEPAALNIADILEKVDQVHLVDEVEGKAVADHAAFAEEVAHSALEGLSSAY